MRFTIGIRIILLLASSMTLWGCQVQGKDHRDPDKKEITPRDLYRAMQQHQKLLVVYGLEHEQNIKQLEQLAGQIKGRNWNAEILLKSHREVTELDLGSFPLLILGSPEFNPWINTLASHLPFSYSNQQLVFDGKYYNSQKHLLLLTYYPNPYNVTLPLSIVASADERMIWQALQDRMAQVFWGNWNYEILQDANRVLIGNFSQNPQDRWEFDPDQKMELPSEFVDQWEQGPYCFRTFHAALSRDSIQSFPLACEEAALKIRNFLGSPLVESISFDHSLYPSTEIKGLITGNTQQSHIDFERAEIHTVLGKHFLKRNQGLENQLLIRTLLGPASNEILEQGLALYFTENWEQHGYEYWSALLINGGNALTIAQLLDDQQRPYFSSLKQQALGASLVHFLIEKWGVEEFLKVYSNWAPDERTAETLTKEWWGSMPAHRASQINSRALPYLKGFNFTHEGYRIYNGYGSKLSLQSLNHLKKLGTNAVAIVPYSGMRDPKKPVPLRFSRSAGGENDEGVIQTIKYAQELGMTTVLKPHLWIRGSWPGAINMASEAEWEAFFEYYYQWISHYALIAEMHQVDMLSIGVEFSQATLGHEDKWRALIRKIRKVYGGKLTYSANWGEEFENISFWDALDYIGLNCYYPLTKKENPSMEQLKGGFQKAMEKAQSVAEEYGKKVIITEIGFRSVDNPWQHPHEEAGSRSFNESHQAMAYQAVFEVLQNQKEIQGVFWWKWPTIMENRPEDRRFVPSGKPTEKVIHQYFQANETPKR